MATILCVTVGLPSVVYKSVELARRLAAAGHRVVFAGQEGDRRLVEQVGLEFLALEQSRYEQFLDADARSGALRRLLALGRRREAALESLALDGFTGSLERLDPDLVLINGEMHEQILAAVGAGRRVALINTFASIWRRPGLPPPSRLVVPGAGWRGSRLSIELLWLELLLRKRLRNWLGRVRRLGCDRPSLLRALARRAGLDFRRETDAGQWLIPFTYRRLPVLSLQAVEFEFPHRPPARVRYVGPMVLERRVDRPLPAEHRARLEAILARRREGGDRRRLIYAGFGSIFTARMGLLRRLFEAVAERPDWELVVSLGERVPSAELGLPPANVQAFAWVPQLDVLRQADAAITHGGVNTINECVLAGVPMLIYCGYETGMAGDTARVGYHGIGIAGDHRDGAPAIRDHLDRLLSEPHFGDNLCRLRARVAAYAEDRVAERAVESLLASAPDGGGTFQEPGR